MLLYVIKCLNFFGDTKGRAKSRVAYFALRCKITNMKLAIIGAGLWGAAAARHLAKAGFDVTLIGPSEPADFAQHSGPFSSHYDEGRITRACATQPFWAQASRLSIARYADIARESGLSFFTPCGALMAGPKDGEFCASVRKTAQELNIYHQPLERSALAEKFPYFNFTDDFCGFYEPDNAGHISPRRLVQAQIKAAQKYGAKLRRQIVTNIASDTQKMRVVTQEQTLNFDQILITAGGWSDHVLARKPQLRVNARTVALFEIEQPEQEKLHKMPSMVFTHKTSEAPYLLPPIQYADGKTYIKLGGDPHDNPLDTQDEIAKWYQSGGSPQVRDYLTDMMRELMPKLSIKAIKMAPCVTTWTADRLPEIRRLGPRVCIATAGNGAGAKCSDEMGRRGAELMAEKPL